MQIVSKVFNLIILSGIILISSCGTNKSTIKNNELQQKLEVNLSGSGQKLSVELEAGNNHNHPSFAIWAEDMNENFLQTIFVTKSVGTGIFGHGPLEAEKWDTKPGWQKRPASLPYWIHKREPLNNGPQLPSPEFQVPDAYTGATPKSGAEIATMLNKQLAGKIRILLEVNQPWDWNEYWTNERYDNADYRTSCQPSLIYSVTVDLNKSGGKYFLNPIGHGHYSGANGDLNTNLGTITTARNIFNSIKVTINE